MAVATRVTTTPSTAPAWSRRPKYLVLHLKRFHYDFKNNRLDKNRAALSFPAKFEIGEWVDAASISTVME